MGGFSTGRGLQAMDDVTAGADFPYYKVTILARAESTRRKTELPKKLVRESLSYTCDGHRITI